MFRCTANLGALCRGEGLCDELMLRLDVEVRAWWVCPRCGSSMGAKFQAPKGYGRLRP